MNEPTPAAQNPGNALTAGGWIFLLIGLALLGGGNYLATKMGYEEGIRDQSCIGSPLSLLEIILVPILLYLLVRIAWSWGRREVGGKMLGFMFLLALQLLFQFLGAYSYSGAQTLSLLSRDRNALGIASRALDAYHQGHAAFPASLNNLIPEQLQAIPQSAFGKDYPLHYALLDDRPTSSTNSWIIWLPGPDRKYDIQEGPSLKTAMQDLAKGRSSPWLTGLTYDPTNGGLSRGDLCRYMGQ